MSDPTPAAMPRRSRTSPLRVAVWLLVLAVPVVFLVVFFAYPVLTIVGRGLFEGGSLDFGAIGEVLSRPRTLRVIGNTLVQATVGTGVSVALSIPTAFVLYRRSFPGRKFLRSLLLVPFVLPAVVVGVAFRALLAPHGPLGFLGWDRTLMAILLALVFFNVGLVVRMVGTVWESLDPRAEQAAQTLGASPLRAALTVTLPALFPVIGSAAVVVFLFCATAFGVVLVIGGSQFATIEVEIWLQTTQFLDLKTAAVLSIVQFGVVILVFWLSSLMRGRQSPPLALADGTVPAPRLRLGKGGSALDRVCTGIALLTGTLILLPLATMLIRSFRKDGAWTLGNYVALGTRGSQALTVNVWDAAINSLRIAVDATAIAVVVGVTLALVLSRRPRNSGARRAMGLLGAFVMMPLGVSAVTVGFGFLISLDRPPLDLRSSLILIPIAQALVATPLVVRSVLPILNGINPRLHQAAATLGASPTRILLTVDGPLMLRSVGLAAGLSFAISLGEFGATSFLVRPDRPTLPIVIYRLLGRPGDGNYEMAVAASVILAIVAGTVMTLAERLQPSTSGPTR
ncbi:iron ABC transporter permease [Actinomycetaceae bacterium MB13-C1-2]|nr:iron ABC transporter permease [Actinomycetaceae bacterium MB13-C1-2]